MTDGRAVDGRDDPADVASAVQAQPGRERPIRIAHLSDPHFGTIQPSVEAGMLQTLREIKPDLLIVSGDLTQRARREQFAAAGRFVRQLAPLPFMVVPGNHDIPLYNVLGRAFAPYNGFFKVFGRQLAPTIELDGIQVLGFTSAPRWRHKHGDIAVDAVAQRLRRHPPRGPGLRIAVFHHPFDYVEAQDEVNLMRRNVALMETLSEAGVDLVLGGHIHDALARTTERRYPGLDRHLVVALAGTCMSWRIRYRTPNTFNLVTARPAAGELLVERWDSVKAELQVRFEPVVHDHFRRLPQGWRLISG